MLTSRQIERYSRQIITQGFGGEAQERLLASRVTVIGNLSDLEPVLPYLVGAGVGHIRLNTDADTAMIAPLQARFKDLNSDVEFSAADQTDSQCDLLLAMVSDQTMAERIHHFAMAHSGTAIIYARLDTASTILVIPSQPPCLRCADVNMDEPFNRPCENPGLVAMIAGLEAIKVLAGIAPSEARQIEFDGYSSSSHPLRQRTGGLSYGCTSGNSR